MNNTESLQVQIYLQQAINNVGSKTNKGGPYVFYRELDIR